MGCTRSWLPVVLSGVALVVVANPLWAKTPTEIESIAQASTVKIEHGEDDIGTGVIVHRQGQVYSLVTNRHVVCPKNNLCEYDELPKNYRYRLSLPDGQQMQVNAKNIQLLGQDLDLAVIRFTSNRSYSLVKVATAGKLQLEDDVFTAGFPESGRFTFGEGKAIAALNRRIQGDKGGYSIIYNALTLPGMSGGGVFNSDGNLVAIHGFGDRYKSGTISDDSRVNSKIGFNRGIPIRWLVQGLGEMGIVIGKRTTLSAIRAVANRAPEVADEYFIAGFNKFVEPGANVIVGKREAVQHFTKAIQLKSNYHYAYFVRAFAYDQIGDFQKSLTDYNKAIILNSSFVEPYYNRGNLKNKLNDPQGALSDYNKAISVYPDFAECYANRGVLKDVILNDLQGALSDYNQAISLDPNDASAYYNRGKLKNKLKDFQDALSDYNKSIALNPIDSPAYNNSGVLKSNHLNDHQGALADYNKAITINPNYALAYYNRGVLKKNKLNDYQGALADYNKAIVLNPNYATVYLNRGVLKSDHLNDHQGAMADYNRVIALNPNDASAHFNRGTLRNKLKDFQGAMADYNKAVQINPQFIQAYGVRGLLKATQLNDRSGGIADLRQAARLARAQDNTQLLQTTLGILNQLGATE